jgi:hypothetical protein
LQVGLLPNLFFVESLGEGAEAGHQAVNKKSTTRRVREADHGLVFGNTIVAQGGRGTPVK